MAFQIFRRLTITGGGGDAINGIDGATLEGNELVLYVDSTGNCCIYWLDASSGATDVYPDIVSPLVNAGSKRWKILGTFYASSLHANWLKFPNTQVPSSDVKTLDDYLERVGRAESMQLFGVDFEAKTV